ncbi:C-terminal binding protein [Klebsiella indica]|uniref:C-terminal binding protein n=1 Tax=Klebsiella indica TaxID=2582917 RepID=A0A5R9LFY1_9ENTR|nr:NAD(P)-dependent oxidoreductase [Klebsiella indica]TLV15647.1 C-terminal binding protein [Klebsiella indica]
MKIVISDYKDSMMPLHDNEITILTAGLPDAEIIIYEYTDEKRDEFISLLSDADALLTAFIRLDAQFFSRAKNLRVVSINATGYDNVDLSAATAHGVGICPVAEYCTRDVAEHTIALMLALNKNLKSYTYDIEQNYCWRYDFPRRPERIEMQTLGIFGLGKIGSQVARLAKALGMRIIAVDPAVTPERACSIGVEMVTPEDIWQKADVITNHMNLGNTNVAYFTIKEFAQMRRNPIFLNLGRGLSVDEAALAEALDRGLVRGVGLDVLNDETPQLAGHPLARRANVIITPHSAFYSTQSMTELQRISCDNIVNFLTGHCMDVFRLVNEV